MAQVGSTLFDIDVDDDDLDIVPATPSPEPSNPVDVEILKSCSKSVAFKLADIGEGIAEVELMEWFVKEGDRVSQFQNLCQVQSDKVYTIVLCKWEKVSSNICRRRSKSQVDTMALFNVYTTMLVAWLKWDLR